MLNFLETLAKMSEEIPPIKHSDNLVIYGSLRPGHISFLPPTFASDAAEIESVIG